MGQARGVGDSTLKSMHSVSAWNWRTGLAGAGHISTQDAQGVLKLCGQNVRWHEVVAQLRAGVAHKYAVQ